MEVLRESSGLGWFGYELFSGQTPNKGPNRHVVPGRRFWRRPGSSGRRAGLKPIAALLVEGSPSPGGPGQASNGGSVQHGGSIVEAGR